MDPLRRKGDSWNESETFQDAWTLRTVRRLTSTGLFNTTPTYHTSTTFTHDGERLVFARGHHGRSAVFAADIRSGQITQLIDSIEGVGNWSTVQANEKSQYADGRGISGPLMCLAPRSRWLLYHAGRSVRAVHLDSLDERVLVEDIGPEWMAGVLSVDPDERHALYPIKPAHPDVAAGREMSTGYMEHFADGGMLTRLVQVPLAGGTAEEVHEDIGAGCSHCPHCPTDGDLVLIDRDFAPKFWAGSDNCQTTRCWILRLSTGELTELRPRNAKRFQVHSAWTWDGQAVVYHGPARDGGHYIGVAGRDGQVIQEWAFPEARHYGHVSAAAGREGVILDGNLSPDLLLWLDYASARPRVEVIARHGTHWRGTPGQLPHPHPHADRTGRSICWNACADGRTDVFVVEV